jgi:GLPGLI family protein
MTIFRTLLIALSLSLGLASSAQNISGTVTYKSASKVNFKMDNPEISPEQKKMIQERMAEAMQKEFNLSFNRHESLYEEVKELERDDQRGMRFLSMISGSNGLYYKNLKEGIYLDQTEFFGKQFLIKDSLEQLDWRLEKGTKSIGKYICNKAVAQRVVTVAKTESVDGNRQDTLTNDTIEITAWYSMQIPISNGPAQYGGLPGLIMELNDGNTTILCTKVSLSPGEEKEIKRPDSGEEVSQAEYEEIITKKMEEMRRMYGGRGQGRGSSSFEIRMGR